MKNFNQISRKEWREEGGRERSELFSLIRARKILERLLSPQQLTWP